MTLILGFFGSADLQLGPNCSRLIRTNPFFVQTIKVIHLIASCNSHLICYLFFFFVHSAADAKCAVNWLGQKRIWSVIFLLLWTGTGTWGAEFRANVIWILHTSSSRCWNCLDWKTWYTCTNQLSQGKTASIYHAISLVNFFFVFFFPLLYSLKFFYHMSWLMT